MQMCRGVGLSFRVSLCLGQEMVPELSFSWAFVVVMCL